MSELNVTPGQREEAVEWFKKHYPQLLSIRDEHRTVEDTLIDISMEDTLVDLYFRLKNIQFDFLPTEFVIGVEYKDEEKAAKGEEKVNIRFQNPHKGEYSKFAFDVIIELLNRLKV